MAETRMRPVTSLISFEEARRRLLASALPFLRSEEAPLEGADGRALAQDIRAPIDVPSFDRSAMDGYAVRTQDLKEARPERPVGLRLREAVHAGDPAAGPLSPQECVQVATGAPIPLGADAVVMVERTRTDGPRILFSEPPRGGENVSPTGGDIAKGSLVLEREARLTPARLAGVAALGVTRLRVYARPRVTILSTGSELRKGGQTLRPGEIYDSNSTALAAVLARDGIEAEIVGPIRDDPVELEKALRAHRDRDMILATGSSSAGERDYLVPLASRLGDLVFHGVHVRPGKPLFVARLAPALLIGLAGNPASCLLMTYALVLPALRQLQHLPLDEGSRVRARLAREIRSPKDKRHFVPVRIREGRAESTYRESDMTTSLLNADGFIEVPDAVESLPADTEVDVVLF